MLIMVPLFLDRHTLHAERCREISTATGIANKGCKLITQPLPPVPDCYCESPVQRDDQKDDREEADAIYEPIDEDGYVKTNFPHADKAAVANEAMYLHVIM